jgi:hypothetical protein
MIAPLGGIVYSYLLHTHSHVMFLGWVLNVLIIAFAHEFPSTKTFKTIFWFLQVCVVGMLISFPLQGYGLYSIAFSTLHTLGAFFFIILFFRSTKALSSISAYLARAALLFFVLSSLGPFSLGYLKANGLEHTNLYRFSIYFYLHFQYNGFFLMAILSLFIKLIEDHIPPNVMPDVKQGCRLLVISCVPAFALSMLWAAPGIIFNVIGAIAAIAQFAGLYLALKPLSNVIRNTSFFRTEKFLLTMSFFALILKLILQLVSAYPPVAFFANEFRPIVIAYLHLVLLGCISFFLIAWMIRKQIIGADIYWIVGLLVAGFVGSQILLVISPWNSSIFDLDANGSNVMLFIFSILMAGGVGLLLGNSFTRRA